MRISESQGAAADALLELVVDRVGTGRAVHPETAIACAARLSGSLLLRSFNLVDGKGVPLEGLPPGAYLLSPQASERTPELIDIMFAVLQCLGVSIDPAKLDGENGLRGEEPMLTTVQVLDLLQTDALSIANSHGLSLEEAALAGALTTAFIVRDCAKDIGAETGINVAAMGFHDGTRTVPPSLHPVRAPEGESKQASKQANEQANEQASKPWYKFW